MRFEKCSLLMTRIHVQHRLKILNLAAAKIQAMYRAHSVRSAFKEIKSKTIQIQRWLRGLKSARTWISALTEGKIYFYNNAATLV